jgi:hypothetical protein
MNLAKKNLYWLFAITLACTLFVPTLYPAGRLFFFIPFLIVTYYQKPYATCLWASLGCGFIVDLLSSASHLGLCAMIYTMTTAILYRQRLNFFGDSLSTLPIMTFFFAVISTGLLSISISIFEHEFHLSWKWLLTDLLLFPLFDSFYAYICFILPFQLFSPQPRKGSDYFTS